MLIWNTWRQLLQIKLPCEFWTEFNPKPLQWTQIWKKLSPHWECICSDPYKDAILYFWSPHAKIKACIKTNTHVCNYPRKHISRWEGGGRGGGYSMKSCMSHACPIHIPDLPYMFWHNIAWKESTFTLTNISFPTSFVSKTAHRAQPRKTCWQTPILISTKWKKQGKDANHNWLWISNILKCAWAWISADHACKAQNTITQNHAVFKPPKRILK